MNARTWIPLLLALALQGGRASAQGNADRSVTVAATSASPHGDLAEACSVCHTATGWSPVRLDSEFDHARTGFSLEGAHARSACRDCHVTLDFADTPSECVTCHQDVHRGELGADCSRCHTPRSFVDRAAMVQLHQAGRFALTGAHLVTDCESCHTPTAPGGLTFVNRPTECESCHRAAYAATTDPPHEAGGFPLDCAQCHATTIWERARFNHDGSAFPLTGAHRSVPCGDCHANHQYAGTPAACASCHQADYDGSTDPSHPAARFPVTCETCHTTTVWSPTSFDHATTTFPLTGAHLATSCADCHADGVFAGKPSACVSCHQADYDGTADPP
ncbi:MAG TPA: hypothetical protein VFU00_01770, partial [Gemmatimonadales bacterium]|nr:hypothetical protein [Gemmatimonadales bacterium]